MSSSDPQLGLELRRCEAAATRLGRALLGATGVAGQRDRRAARAGIGVVLSAAGPPIPEGVLRAMSALQTLLALRSLDALEVEAIRSCLRQILAVLTTDGLPAPPPEPERPPAPPVPMSRSDFDAAHESAAGEAGFGLGDIAAIGAAVVVGAGLLATGVAVISTVGAAAVAAAGGGVLGQAASVATAEGTKALIKGGVEELAASGSAPPPTRGGPALAYEWMLYVGLTELPKSYDEFERHCTQRRREFECRDLKYREARSRYERARSRWTDALEPITQVLPIRPLPVRKPVDQWKAAALSAVGVTLAVVSLVPGWLGGVVVGGCLLATSWYYGWRVRLRGRALGRLAAERPSLLMYAVTQR